MGSAVAGATGDALLGDNDNFWTAWIVPIGAVVFAASFTEFHPDHATGGRRLGVLGSAAIRRFLPEEPRTTVLQ